MHFLEDRRIKIGISLLHQIQSEFIPASFASFYCWKEIIHQNSSSKDRLKSISKVVSIISIYFLDIYFNLLDLYDVVQLLLQLLFCSISISMMMNSCYNHLLLQDQYLLYSFSSNINSLS